MEYAICLCFDKDTESSFNNIIMSIATSGASTFMIDSKIPPHIGLACFCTEDIATITDEMDKHISEFVASDIAWPSLGTFVPSVLFAAPILNEYLLNSCISINRLIEHYSTVGGNGFYLPNSWVPHTTLAMHLGREELVKAFDIASRQFTFICGKSNRLLFAECSPYKEIKIWDLS